MRYLAHPRSILIVISLASMVLFGCANRPQQFIDLSNKQDYAAALVVAREEVAHPTFPGDAWMADIRSMNIKALNKYSEYHGYQPSFDEEVERLLNQGLQYAQSDDLSLSRLFSHAGNYFSTTYRSGKAIKYFQESLKRSEASRSEFMVIMMLHNIADSFQSIGDLLQRDHYRDAAIQRGRHYFQPELFRTQEGQLQMVEWGTVVRAKMDDLAQEGKSREIITLWQEVLKPILNHFSTRYMFYLNTAELVALSNDHNFALQLFDEGQKIAATESHPLQVMDFACIEMVLRGAAGQFQRGVELMKTCQEERNRNGVVRGSAIFFRSFGEIHEGAGQLEAAATSYLESIQLTETSRGSFPTQDRGTFFQGMNKKSYWGLIRVRAKQYLAQPDQARFHALLKATETIRARQFSEMQGNAALAIDLGKLQDKLGDHEALLDYIVMDNVLVVMAITRTGHHAWLLPLEAKSFREEIRSLLSLLTSPNGNEAILNAGLAKLSTQILQPTRQVLNRMTSLIILPDGLLNAIPFELLTLGGEKGRLFQEMAVRELPSLKHFIANTGTTSETTSGYLGIANPSFAKNPKMAGLSTEEVRSITRSNQFLSYFSPLPETQQEVQTIAGLFPSNQPSLLMGADARESRIKTMDLRGYRYLHFATHGILGNDVPGMTEPALVMAVESTEDGFLTLEEARNLKLNADLTVLSACNTGSGDYLTGEGVMGMSRAFLVAGSRAVVVSLWPVASQETVALMTRFYGYLLKQKLPPAEALRRAKLDLFRRSPWSEEGNEQRGFGRIPPSGRVESESAQTLHPFYWAPFILIGA